jgi:hypothetical protein
MICTTPTGIDKVMGTVGYRRQQRHLIVLCSACSGVVDGASHTPDPVSAPGSGLQRPEFDLWQAELKGHGAHGLGRRLRVALSDFGG